MSFKSLINTSTRLRVSSVLNKETRVYGKQFLADGKEETCWSSDPCEDGSYQWILVNFEKPEEVSSLEIKFQGGFASSEVVVEVMLDGRFKPVKSLYPEDVNSSQVCLIYAHLLLIVVEINLNCLFV